MQHILITTFDVSDSLSSTMLDLLKQEGYEVSPRPRNHEFGISPDETDNEHLWRALPGVIRAATKAQGRIFENFDGEPSGKIVHVPDDVNWRIAHDSMDREFVEEIHRTWR